MGYLDDAVFVLCCGLVWFILFELPGVLSKRQGNKLKLAQEKTKQTEAIMAAEASKLEAKRLEQRQYNNYDR